MPRKTTSRAGAALKALLSLVVLAALLTAVPVLLWRLGVLPSSLPSWGDVGTALTSPDNGALFLGALTLLGWAGWLQFTFSVLIELYYSLLRHRSAPRIRALGASQRLAGVLVASIVLLLPTGAAMASPGPASAATAATTPHVTTVTPQAQAIPPSTDKPWTGPVYEVRDGDTLWGIAQAHLGDGIRWHEISNLNAGVRQSDGTVMTADTIWLQPGWILRMPGGDTTTTTLATAPGRNVHLVKPGETLSAIAEHELGDADRYPEIVSLNEGHPQLDGGTLTDPDTILPGWELAIPGPPTTTTPPQSTPPAPAGEQAVTRPATPVNPAAPTAPATPPASTPAASQGPAAPSTTPTRPAQSPATATPRSHSAPASTPAEEQPAPEATAASANTDDGDVSSTITLVGAGTAFLAAGITATIGVRRTLQQRRRRHRRRIPMPEPEVATLEREMRDAQHTIGPDYLDRALRTLAIRCAEAGRTLPEIEAIHLTPGAIDLFLAAPTVPIRPFTPSDLLPDVWTCPARSTHVLSAQEACATPSPYPALVSLGSGVEEDSTVLVNLEAVGLLALDGGEQDVREVLLALAAELCTSQLTKDSSIVLARLGSELADRFPACAEYHPDHAEAVEELRAHDALQRAALEASGAESLGEARLDGAGADAWTTKILLTHSPVLGDEAQYMEDVLLSRPRTAVAIVAAADGDVTVPGGWVLDASPDALVTLPGIELEVALQRLSSERYEKVVALLAIADREDDVDPPAWTRGDGLDLDDSAFADPEDLQDEPGFLSAVLKDVDSADETAVQDEVPPWQAPQLATAAPLPDFTAMLLASRTELVGVEVSDAADRDADEGPDAEEGQDEVEAPRRLSAISEVLVALNTAPEKPQHPQVRLLGPVELFGALGSVESNRERTLLEMAAWFVLYPGRRYEELDASLWPDKRVTAQFRNPLVAKLRNWIGRNPALAADDPEAQYLPPARQQSYRFHPSVTSDWAAFQKLYVHGMDATGPEANLALAQALTLVRGRPFANVNPARYNWAEPDIQEMISAIVDVAHELAERCIATRDYRAAAMAASKGLAGVPDSELLYRDLFLIHHATGDREGLKRAAHQLARINDELETDPEDETVELLARILETRRNASAV